MTILTPQQIRQSLKENSLEVVNVIMALIENEMQSDEFKLWVLEDTTKGYTIDRLFVGIQTNLDKRSLLNVVKSQMFQLGWRVDVKLDAAEYYIVLHAIDRYPSAESYYS